MEVEVSLPGIVRLASAIEEALNRVEEKSGGEAVVRELATHTYAAFDSKLGEIIRGLYEAGALISAMDAVVDRRKGKES